MNPEVTTEVPATENSQPEVSGSSEATTATVETPAAEATTQTPAEKKAKQKGGKAKAAKPEKLSKTAFIDKQYLQHTKNGKTQIPKGTAEAIYKEVVKAKYIDPKNEREVEATMNTIRCRPWHMRKAGKMPASTRGANKGGEESES